MTIRNKTPEGANASWEYHRRKADQHWDMAGLARQDGDRTDAERHTSKAREHEALARESLSSPPR